jgi:hypothetical protein
MRYYWQETVRYESSPLATVCDVPNQQNIKFILRLFAYDSVWFGRWLQTFRNNIVPPFSRLGTV